MLIYHLHFDSVTIIPICVIKFYCIVSNLSLRMNYMEAEARVIQFLALFIIIRMRNVSFM